MWTLSIISAIVMWMVYTFDLNCFNMIMLPIWTITLKP